MRIDTKEIFNKICEEKGAWFVHNLKNPVKINGNTTTMYFMFQGEVYECLFDTEDLQKICVDCTWVGNNSNTSQRIRVKANINGVNTFIYHLFVGREKGKVIDHINRDTLDNRKCNLRIVTHKQNMLNKDDYSNKSISKLIMHRGDKYIFHIQRIFWNYEIAEKAKSEIVDILDKYGEIDSILRNK